MTNPSVQTLAYQNLFQETLLQIESGLNDWLSEYQHPETLWNAIRYACQGGGKRLRPVLLLECTRACGGETAHALPTAIALEMIHCASLIHDDLPCMDDDDLRRGKPTTHKAFSETTALLAGDAINVWVYGQIIQKTPALDSAILLNILESLSTAASVGKNGHDGLVSGQELDMVSGNGKQCIDEAQLRQIHRGKTGALIAFACEAGALIAGQRADVVSQFRQLGEHLGLLFQIKDDILDVESDAATLGKTPGKDAEQNKATFPAIVGLSKSRLLLEEEGQHALAILDHLTATLGQRTIQTDALRHLIQFFVQREH